MWDMEEQCHDRAFQLSLHIMQARQTCPTILMKV